MVTLAELITRSFYAWEIRGRGWQLADYPVSLEPPHRPFFLLPDVNLRPERIDDGWRPGLLDSLVAGTKWLFGETPAKAVETHTEFEEQAPFPAEAEHSHVTFRLSVPPDFASDPETARQLLLGLATTMLPVSFELVGCGGRVTLQIVASDIDEEQVRATVAGLVPEAVLVTGEDALEASWDGRLERVFIDFGLSQEFFLPLQSVRSFSVDPYGALVSTLARAGRGECCAFQVLFERVRNPWDRSVANALGDGEGGCIFADAPELLPLSSEKAESPFFAVVLRIAAGARTKERAWELARGMSAFVLQFARPGSNELLPLTNDGYPDSIHEEALIFRQSYRTGMLLSLKELAGLVHLPDRSVRHPALVREERRTKGAPAEATGHPVVLGVNEHHGVREPVTLSTEARLQHAHVIGASGAGKSTLLLNVIMQDIEQGRGVAVIDPHGDLIDDILARIPEKRIGDVVLFDPADEEWPVGLNILSARTEIERILLSSDLVGVFQRFATSWGDTMSTVLGNAVLAMLSSETPATLVDLRRFLLDDRFRKDFLARVPDDEIRLFWDKQYPLIGTRSVGPILARLDAFLRPRLIRYIVGQKEAKLDLGAVLRDGKVFLVKLAHGLIGEENAHLLGSLLVAKFHQCALARQREAAASRTPFFLSIDEVQHFVTPSMCSLLSGARKYGLGLTLAHQTLSQLAGSPELEGALLGNAYTRVVFRVGDDDAKKLAEGFSFFTAKDLASLSRGEAIVRIGGSANDCNLETFPAKRMEEGAAERIARIVARSRERYAVAREEVERALAVLREIVTPEPPIVEPAEIVREVAHPPEPTPTTIPPPAEASPPGVPVPKKRTAQRKPLGEVAPLGRGGREHKYLQHLIKRLGEERGFRAFVEESVPDGRVDVVLRKESISLAFEISVTTEIEHELANLRKCLGAEFTKVFCVLIEVKRKDKFVRALKAADMADQVDVLGPEEIVTALESVAPAPVPETTIRGYKVKVSRQAVSPDDVAGRRAAIASVIARSLGRTGKT